MALGMVLLTPLAAWAALLAWGVHALLFQILSLKAYEVR